ncbi:unnamed protein product, partial [Ectocarpus sp. 8 AP-2014]
ALSGSEGIRFGSGRLPGSHRCCRGGPEPPSSRGQQPLRARERPVGHGEVCVPPLRRGGLQVGGGVLSGHGRGPTAVPAAPRLPSTAGAGTVQRPHSAERRVFRHQEGGREGAPGVEGGRGGAGGGDSGAWAGRLLRGRDRALCPRDHDSAGQGLSRGGGGCRRGSGADAAFHELVAEVLVRPVGGGGRGRPSASAYPRTPGRAPDDRDTGAALWRG